MISVDDCTRALHLVKKRSGLLDDYAAFCSATEIQISWIKSSGKNWLELSPVAVTPELRKALLASVQDKINSIEAELVSLGVAPPTFPKPEVAEVA